MKTEIVMEGSTVEEAVDAALEELGVQQDAVEYEVIDEPTRRIFGSDKPAKVVVRLRKGFVESLRRDEGEEPLPVPAAEAEAPHPGASSAGSATEEQLDQLADTAVDVIKNILDRMGIDASIDEYEGDEGEIILDIVGADLGALIGRHGRTLDALQTLVVAATNRRLDFRYPIVVDVEGYRSRRKEKLEGIAQGAADRAVRTGRAVQLRPMTSYERRIVHIVLRKDARVQTESEGEDPTRKVVVRPTGRRSAK